MNDRQVTVGLDLNNSAYIRGILAAAAATRAFSREANVAGRSISSGFDEDVIQRNFGNYTRRLELIIDTLGTFGTAVAPLGAVAVPVITGLANALGMAALSGGTAIIAFQGVGDALTKLHKAQIDPTTANIKNARIAMAQLSDEAKDMVRTLNGLRDEWRGLRDAAAEGLFPGVTEALDTILARAPEVELILKRIGDVTGEMAAAAADDLVSNRWDDFFTFIGNEGPKSIAGLAQATGNLAHAFAELWMAFQPLNNTFIDWLVEGSAAIDKWATGLSKTEGFKEFLAYIQANAPVVGEFLESVAMAIVHILEAAAPVGSVVLPVLTALFDVIGAIAESPLGTPLLGLLALTSAMKLFDRAMLLGPIQSMKTFREGLLTMARTESSLALASQRVTRDINGRFHAESGKFMSGAQVTAWREARVEAEKYGTALKQTQAQLKSFAKTAGVVGGLMLATSGVTEQLGITNTVLGATIGLMAGPWGAAVGGGIGLLMDFAAAGRDSKLSVEDLTAAMNEQTGALDVSGYRAIAEELFDFKDGLDAVGISLADATLAVAKGGKPLDDMIAQVDAAILALASSHDDLQGLQRDAAIAIDAPKLDALIAFRNVLTDSDSKVRQAAEGFEKKQAAQEAAAAADREATGALNEFNDAISKTLTGISALNGLLAERDLTRAFNQSWLDLNDTVEKNGDVWDKTSKRGVENWEKLDAHVKNAIARVDDYRKHNRDAAAQGVLDKALRQLRQFREENPKSGALINPLIALLNRLDHSSIFTRALRDLHKFQNENPGAREAVQKLLEKLQTLDGKGSATKALAALREFKRRFPEAAAAVQPLINKLKDADKQDVKPKIDVDTDSALRKLGNFQGAVNALHGKEVLITVRTEHMDVRLGPIRGATGGLITGPGTATSDSIPANLSTGEFVMRAAAVRRYGPAMFQRLNMGGGGLVPTGPTYPGLPGGGPGPKFDNVNAIDKIFALLFGTDFGPGMTRKFQKELDALVKQIAEHRKHVAVHNRKVDAWNKAHPDEKPRKHQKFELTDEIRDAARDLAKEIRDAAKERKHAIRAAFHDFALDLADGAQSIQDEVSSLRHSLREAGGVWTKAMGHHAQHILTLAAQYDAAAKTLEDQQGVLDKMLATGEELQSGLDDLLSQQAALSSQVQGHFSADAFGNGLSGFFQTTGQNTAQASMFQDVLQQLKAMGLDGPAFEALAASGDIKTAVQLLNSGMINQFEESWTAQTNALSSLGGFVGDTVFGQQIAAQNVLITDNNAAIANQNVLIAATQTTMANLQAAVDRQEAALSRLAGLDGNVQTGARRGTYDGAYDGVKDALRGVGPAQSRAG